jgi:hypothetical protein
MTNVFRVAWLIWLTLIFSGPLQAAIYRCADGQFQDRPCVGERVGEAAPAVADVDQGKHFIWQATAAGKGTLYLLGSIHFGTQEMYPLPSVITSAFAQSDSLVVEANILEVDPMQMAQLVASTAIYRDGSTLQQHLSTATWQRLTEVAATMNLPVELVNQQKPWFVSMTLSALALNRFGYSEELGIDRHFLSQAQGRKKIIELESVEWQLSLFDKLTPDEQVLMLEETLRELGDGKAFFERMLKAWKRGDAKDVQALFDEGVMNEPRSAHLNQLMILDRNRTMVATLEKLASQGGRYFVVVGAGHLTGEAGIIELLRKRGYQVSQY